MQFSDVLIGFHLFNECASRKWRGESDIPLFDLLHVKVHCTHFCAEEFVLNRLLIQKYVTVLYKVREIVSTSSWQKNNYVVIHDCTRFLPLSVCTVRVPVRVSTCNAQLEVANSNRLRRSYNKQCLCIYIYMIVEVCSWAEFCVELGLMLISCWISPGESMRVI